MENWASLVAHLVKNPPAMWRPGFDPWVGKIPWRKERLPTPVFWPGEFHERDSPWGSKELDTTEQLSKKKKKGKLVEEVHYLQTGTLVFFFSSV